jgi:hypothetical protein
MDKVQLRRYRLSRIVAVSFVLVFPGLLGHIAPLSNQQTDQWSPQQQIPGFDPRTSPPIMVADEHRTVHTFSSQWMDQGVGHPQVAIFYNQWSIDRGWSQRYDILLSPLNNTAWIMDAHLDKSGMMHLIFYGGDNTRANIYYSRAPAVQAYDAKAWSPPEIIGSDASGAQSAVFAEDDRGNFYLLYVGEQNGGGVFASYSGDSGKTWTQPTPLFLTSDSGLIPISLHMYLGQSGYLHAIWNVVTSSGQGRSILYSQLKTGDFQWSQPATLAEASSGYGTNTPAIIEHGGDVLAVYNVTPKIIMRRSTDGGQTWGIPVVPFSRHVGVNGNLSLVTDSNNDLHLFFGQRITGNPDIHGMWRSQWLNDRWSVPEAVVSGPTAMLGNTLFDPFAAQAVASQGNVILVTWRTDPGNGTQNENGVWYSYAVLDAPELPVKLLATVVASSTPLTATAAKPPEATSTPVSITLPAGQSNLGTTNQVNNNDPIGPSLVGTAIALLLVLVAGAWHLINHRHSTG